MQSLINALGDNIREIGHEKYKARCPVHGDKDFAMSIRRTETGSIVAHCFACQANGYDLYKHLNLDLDELFGGRTQKTDRPPKYLLEDKLMIEMYERAKANKEKIRYSDEKRYRLARARLDKYLNV